MSDHLAKYNLTPLHIPTIAHTLNGKTFNPKLDVWSIRDAVQTTQIDFASLPVTIDFRLAIKRTFLWYFENRSFSTADSIVKQLRLFLINESKWSGKPVDEVTASVLMRYRSTLSQRQEYRLAHLSYFFKKWYELQLPGITYDAYQYLNRSRFHWHAKGEAVRTMDLERGPFSHIESSNLLNSLEHAFIDGQVTLENYCLATLFALFGARPVQYALLKVDDVFEDVSPGGVEYFIRIPRAKDSSSLPRQEFRLRYLIPRVGKRLMQHAHATRNHFSTILPNSEQTPLFPSRSPTSRDAPQGFQYHNTADTLAQRCRSIFSGLGVISERTGDPIKVQSRRFRYTLATRAAEAGYSSLVIADLLDHLNTTYIPVYIKASATIISRLDKRMAKELAPLADAFRGSVIESNKMESSETKPYPEIVDPRFNEGKSIGKCAHHAPCNLLVPIACYTCNNFRPFVDAPHERLLDYLVSERSRQYTNTSPALASSNDLTIAAVAQVMEICEDLTLKRKNERNA